MEELDGLLQINSKEMLKLRELANTCQGEVIIITHHHQAP